MRSPEPAQPFFPLRQLTRRDVALAGAKAANLGNLIRAGFPVPDGFVVTTASDEEVLAAAWRL